MTNLEALEAAALADKRNEHTVRGHGLVVIWDGAFEYYRAADFDAGVYEPLAQSIAAELADGGILVSSHGGNSPLPTAEPMRNSINPAWKALSEHGKAALSYCRAHASVSQYGDTKGLSVVFMCWRDLAADMGIDIDAPGSTGLMLDALAELRAAGCTRFFDHGTTAYGQVSTILN